MAEETYQEVVDKISENPVEEVVKDEVPNPKGDFETIEEEKEENETTDFESETKPVEKVAMKKKQPSCRAKLRDKVTCPKCGKELSRHSHEYTHSKFCIRKPHKPAPVEEEEEEEEEVKEITKKMEQMTITELIEETKPKPKAKPKPKPKPQPEPKKYEEQPKPTFVEQYIPNDDDIKRYLSNVRKEKAMRKQQGYDKLMSSAF